MSKIKIKTDDYEIEIEDDDKTAEELLEMAWNFVRRFLAPDDGGGPPE